MTHPTDDEIDAIAAQTLGEHTANKLTGIKRFARALLATQVRPENGTQATREPVGLPVFTPLNPIQGVYEKLHAGKLGAHWLWVVIEQIAAGIPEADAMREFGYYATQPLKAEQAKDAAEDAPKLWLWQNFVDGRPEYWAFDNPYPINLTDGDPQTLGEPCGYAIFKPSRQGRFDKSEEQVLAAIARAARAAERKA